MRVQLNRMFRGVQGQMDDVIYKRFEDRTISVPKPRPFTGPPSAAQVRIRERFAEASAYAKAVFRDNARKLVYTSAAKAVGRSTPFAIAMGDYFNLPQVTEVDLTGFNGFVGNLIRIKAVDDFEIVSVSVRILDAAGEVIEEGDAIKGDVRWDYTAQSVAPRGVDLTVEVTALDRPGGKTVRAVNWRG